MKRNYIIFLFLFQNIMLFAQNKTSVFGTVLDEFGTPISNVHVKIESSTSGAVTDSNGFFELKNISEGQYRITASIIGFITQTKSIRFQENHKNTLSFSLQLDVQEIEEVIIIAESTKSEKEKTAQAIKVIDVKEAKLKTADLGEIIAQTEGVSVRKSGGLGSKSKFSLNGLTGNQIRFFMDGIPLKFNGYTFGISTVPVNLIDHIEIYKGVVPIQFGADALAQLAHFTP